MTETAAEQPPNEAAHPSQEIPAVEEPPMRHRCRRTTLGIIKDGFAKERLKLGAVGVLAACTVIGTAWMLIERGVSSAEAAAGKVEERQKEVNRLILDELKATRADVRDLGRRMDRYWGPMSPTPMVREPDPLPLVRERP